MKFLSRQKSSKQMGGASPKRDTLAMCDGLGEPSSKPLDEIKVSSPK